MVVDDETVMRESLHRALTLEGWIVVEAASGEAALELVTRIAPDVVLLDQRLLGMSGLECAAKLRELSGDTRIILFSAYLDDATMKEARQLRLLPLDKTDHRRLKDLLTVLANQVRGGGPTVVEDASTRRTPEARARAATAPPAAGGRLQAAGRGSASAAS